MHARALPRLRPPVAAAPAAQQGRGLPTPKRARAYPGWLLMIRFGPGVEQLAAAAMSVSTRPGRRDHGGHPLHAGVVEPA